MKLTKALAIVFPDGSTRMVTMRQSEEVTRKIKRDLFKDAKSDIISKLKKVRMSDCSFLVEDEKGNPKEV